MAVQKRTPAIAGAYRCGELNVVGTFHAPKSRNYPKRDTAAQAEGRADGHHRVAELWPPNRDLKSWKPFCDMDDGKVIAWPHLRDAALDREVTLPQVDSGIAGVEGFGDNVEVGYNLRSTRPGPSYPSRAQPVVGRYREDRRLDSSRDGAPVGLCAHLRLERCDTGL
jgi:hypothetical protein